MKNKVENEIKIFEQTPHILSKYKVEKLTKQAFRIHFGDIDLPSDKKVALTLMAVTHGNEVGGIATLNRLVRYWADSTPLPLVVDLILGNVEASIANKRYLDRDLNRSFGRQDVQSREDIRARELEPFLSETCFLLDIHQTIEACDRPFFIFGYNNRSFEFACSLDEQIPIVTHWGKGFSNDGLCTDEFTNTKGGIGITIELGKKGFGTYMEAVGMSVSLSAMNVVHKVLSGEDLSSMANPPQQLYTWGEVIPWPSNKASLDKGWYNFKEVEKGQILGKDGNSDILASVSGPILFPKYPGAGEKTPAEICRILKPIKVGDLGK